MSLRHRGGLGLLWVGLFLAARPAHAVSQKLWTVQSQKDYLEGKPVGLKVTARGELELGPEVRELAGLDESVVWAVADGGPRGTWVGTGSRGRLLLVSASGEVSTAAQFDALQVTALVEDGAGGVYAATSPEGAVYRVRPGKEPEEVARPGAYYIWALARGAGGELYVGTGVEGKVFVVRDGKLETLYGAPDLNVVSLLPLPDGSVVVGTDGRGLVIRLDGKGKPRVLHDSDRKETKALVRGPDGAIYAAINGGPSVREQGGPDARGGAQAVVTVTAEEGPEAQPTPPAQQPQGQPPGRQQALAMPPPEAFAEAVGEVVRIRAGEPVEVLAQIRGEMLYSLAFTAGDELVAATSRRLLYPISKREPSVLAMPGDEPTQVSALVKAGKDLLAATTEPSRLFRIPAGRAAEGTYTSKAINAETDAEWGTLRWTAALPPGSRLEIETRSGMSADPDSTWSPWTAAPPAGESLGRVASPGARYLQWRARLRDATGDGASNPGPGPRIQSVSVVYLPRNLGPEVSSFVAQPPGIVYARPGSPYLFEPVPPPLPGMFEELGPAKPEPLAGLKRGYRRGGQSFSWEVADPNGDAVRVRLEVGSRGGDTWFPLAEGVEGTTFSFDTEALPDGWYVGRLEANDGAANPADRALSTRRDSDPFLVDNTPPRVRVASAEVKGRRGHVEVEAEDALSTLWRAEWSLDGKPFEPLYPEDGIADSLKERYRVETRELGAGEHVVVVRVYDLANQRSSVMTRLVVP